MIETRQWFQALSLEDKRDQLNQETRTLLLFINQIVADNKDAKEYFNYVPSNSNETMKEDDFLTEEYLQIIEAKQKLINIFK